MALTHYETGGFYTVHYDSEMVYILLLVVFCFSTLESDTAARCGEYITTPQRIHKLGVQDLDTAKYFKYYGRVPIV